MIGLEILIGGGRVDVLLCQCTLLIDRENVAAEVFQIYVLVISPVAVNLFVNF